MSRFKNVLKILLSPNTKKHIKYNNYKMLNSVDEVLWLKFAHNIINMCVYICIYNKKI